jgi:hypothetical protein
MKGTGFSPVKGTGFSPYVKPNRIIGPLGPEGMLFQHISAQKLPSGAKAHCSCFLYVRAEARTLRTKQFFRSMLTPDARKWTR